MYKIPVQENINVNKTALKNINDSRIKGRLVANDSNMVAKRVGGKLIIASNKECFRAWWKSLAKSCATHSASKNCSVKYYRKQDLYVINSDDKIDHSCIDVITDYI